MLPNTSDRLSHVQSRLIRHMGRPQRHRLLHGYPLAAAMPFVDQDTRRRAGAGEQEFCHSTNPGDALLVGVLPHPFCNPKISGCGFCTFPHESYNAAKSVEVVHAVTQELDQRLAGQPEDANARVDGLYFGGGTANLTPPQPFRHLARKLAATFDLSDAEVSLEGVPARFVRGEPLLIDVMQEELPARHFRISMGIQTFSESRLEQMGRIGFGRPSTFESAVKLAHRRGMTISGDLLFNLPSQSLAEMCNDVRRAVEIGLDQICLYHLVMFRGLGSVWSRDEALLSTLPGNIEAAENWLALREHLLANGFRQTTLTNFERAELADDPRRYRYEPISFESDQCRVLGFGPSGISFSATPDSRRALKTMNPESSAEFLQRVHGDGISWNRFFHYQAQDLEVLHFTRRIASLQIDKQAFSRRFGPLAWDTYGDKFDALIEEQLLKHADDVYALTPRGMFFADSIAGLLAEGQGRGRGQRSEFNNSNAHGHM